MVGNFGWQQQKADRESSDDNIVGAAESQPMRSMFIEVKVCTLPILIRKQ